MVAIGHLAHCGPGVSLHVIPTYIYSVKFNMPITLENNLSYLSMLLVPVSVPYPIVPPKRYTYSLLSLGLIQALPAMRSFEIAGLLFYSLINMLVLTLVSKHAGFRNPTRSWIVKVMDVDGIDGDSAAKVATK